MRQKLLNLLVIIKLINKGNKSSKKCTRNKKSYIYRAIEFAPIWIVLTFGRILPFWVRAKMFAFLGGIIVTHFPKARKRVHKGLRIAFPNLGKKK